MARSRHMTSRGLRGWNRTIRTPEWIFAYHRNVAFQVPTIGISLCIGNHAIGVGKWGEFACPQWAGQAQELTFSSQPAQNRQKPLQRLGICSNCSIVHKTSLTVYLTICCSFAWKCTPKQSFALTSVSFIQASQAKICWVETDAYQFTHFLIHVPVWIFPFFLPPLNIHFYSCSLICPPLLSPFTVKTSTFIHHITRWIYLQHILLDLHITCFQNKCLQVITSESMHALYTVIVWYCAAPLVFAGVM